MSIRLIKVRTRACPTYSCTYLYSMLSPGPKDRRAILRARLGGGRPSASPATAMDPPESGGAPHRSASFSRVRRSFSLAKWLTAAISFFGSKAHSQRMCRSSASPAGRRAPHPNGHSCSTSCAALKPPADADPTAAAAAPAAALAAAPAAAAAALGCAAAPALQLWPAAAAAAAGHVVRCDAKSRRATDVPQPSCGQKTATHAQSLAKCAAASPRLPDHAQPALLIGQKP